MFGAALSLLLLDKELFAPNLGWRPAFGLGAVLGLGILLVRRNVPESPRWMFIHGHNEAAEELVDDVERQVEEQTGQRLEEVEGSIKIRQRRSIGFGVIAHTAFKRYPKRNPVRLREPARAAAARPPVRHRRPPDHDHPVLHAVRGAADRYRAAVQRRDPVGHHPDRLLGGGVLLRLGRGQRRLPDRQRDLPHGDRAMALAFFYAVGTGIGGVTGPALFAKLVETGKEVNVFYGYLLGAALMIAAGVAEWFIGVEAAGKSLEDVARPLTAHEEEGEGAQAPA
jgi:MFS family permease